ncbi:MAG: carbohydrate-binding domain-containing protein [Lachnospiraceae bacterium]|nr:carbohydrate-binding domain-containing protein [Lachnospiraceae bacterium]
MRKNIDKICVACTIAALLITVLFMNGESLGIEAIVDEDAEMYSSSIHFSTNDLNPDWDTSDATKIALNGDEATVSGGGAYAYEGDVIIGQAGDYVLSGQLSDGSIIVDSNNSSKIWIYLDGVDLNCSDSAAFRVEQADKVFLTLADGSENRIASGADYSSDAVDDGVDGALYSKDDVTINGNGSLVVEAQYKHGIAANDDLVLAGGSLEVTAPQDAIHANDSVRIREAEVSLSAEDDGLAVAKEDGYFYMESGSVSIDSGDDAVHTAGDIEIVGGDIQIAAADDGLHSDTAIAVSGGQILLSECYEGLEALTIDVSGGDLEIHATDDALNANGGSSDMGMGGPPGGGMGGPPGEMEDGEESAQKPENAGQETPESTADAQETDEEEETWIHISGGNLSIINESGRDADGIDSNGDIQISGGTIRVSLVNDGGNNALDCGSESGGIIEVNGGDLVACGSSGMVETISDTSTQCSILYVSEEEIAAGTEITLKDADGKTLLSYEPPCSFSAVHMSCPELSEGETYHLEAGEISEDITMDSVSKSVGVDENRHGGMGGRGMGGGMHGPGGWNRDGNFPGAATPSEIDKQGMMPPDLQQDAQEEEEDAAVDTRTDIRDLGKDTWMSLGAAGGALLLGILFAVLWM